MHQGDSYITCILTKLPISDFFSGFIFNHVSFIYLFQVFLKVLM